MILIDTPFSEVFDFYNGKAIKNDNHGNIPIFGSNGIIGSTKKPLYNDAIILGRVGAYCGSVMRCKQDFWASDNTIVVKPKQSKADINYCYYLLINLNLNKYAGGAAQPLITQTTLKQIVVKLPGILEQRRIAEILSAYDDLIENNQQQIKLLEEAAMRLYKEWFVYLRFPEYENTPIVDGVPEGWLKGKLSELIEIRYGKDHKKIPDGDIPVYGSGGLMRKCNQKLYEGESILIPRKGSLNNIIYINEAFWTVDTMFYTEIRKEYYAKYVYYILCAYDMYGMNIGAAVPSMTTSILNSFDIVIPPLEVMKVFDEMLEPMFNKKKVLLKQCDFAAQARDKLLPKLMSGEIEV